MLEDTIAQLEARIQELEHPTSTPSLVMLHDPHSAFFETQRPPIPGAEEELSSSALLSSTEFTHASHSPASASPLAGASVTASSDRYSDRTGSAAQTPRSSSSMEWLVAHDPPANVSQEL